MENSVTAFMNRISGFGLREQDRIRAALSLGEGEELDRSIEIASILLDINLDGDTVAAALLLGFAGAPEEERFGPAIVRLVEGVRKTSEIPAENKTIREAENIRKMLFAMTADIRVIFIKLTERLCAMRRADRAPVEPAAEPSPLQQKAVAQECLDIYAPLADRLGISWIKDELEDLALKQLNRETYNQIKKIVADKREERDEFLGKIQADIQREAAAAGIPIEVSSRAKHFYSIYQKMRRRNKAAGDLYDLFGIRILCGSIEHCYTILGLVHRLWKPLEGRFKDYIAMPKSNGYQSLHTTVIAGPPESRSLSAEGRTLEIQIRTREMHHVAEYGVASHWLYKKGSSRDLVRPVDISIVNRLRDWKNAVLAEEGGDSESFLEELKREILRDSIYVFTPMGKVIELPAGATPIDFAYSIHSAIGEHCVGAKADGSIIPLGSELRNTQVVEILTSPQAHPHINWLRIVKTSKARGKIRSWLEQNDQALQEKTAGKKQAKPREAGKKTEAGDAGPGPGTGDTQPVQLLVRNSSPGSATIKVRIQDEKNMLLKFANCCKPVVGDPIIGYVSRGRGIIIHRSNCPNLANIAGIEERRLDAEWENASPDLVRRFVVEARMALNLFSEIEGAIRKYRGHLIEGRFEETGTSHLTGSFVIQLESPEDLKKITKAIRGIPAVYSIRNLV
jgi:GTP pyrophosphokinase